MNKPPYHSPIYTSMMTILIDKGVIHIATLSCKRRNCKCMGMIDCAQCCLVTSFKTSFESRNTLLVYSTLVTQCISITWFNTWRGKPWCSGSVKVRTPPPYSTPPIWNCTLPQSAPCAPYPPSPLASPASGGRQPAVGG